MTATAAVFLASSAGFITGRNLVIDGGCTVQGMAHV